MPQQFQKFWSVWGADRPPDPVCLDDLILKHSFTESAAGTFLRVYDDTIAFAGLSNDDIIMDKGGDINVATEFAIGDYVNWECNGQIQWNKARKIVALDQHENGNSFYRVEGITEDETGWIPVEQAIERHEPLIADPNLFAPPKPTQSASITAAAVTTSPQAFANTGGLSLNITKPIFDFATVKVITEIDNKEDLQTLIGRLNLILEMLPSKAEQN